MTQKRNLFLFGLIPLLVLLWVAPTLAQGQATAVSTSSAQAAINTTQQEVTVGDPVELTLTVNHPADTQALFPDLAEAWPEVTVVEQAVPQTAPNTDGSLTTTQTVDVRLFTPGAFETSPIVVTLSDAAGNVSAVPVAGTAVSVASVLIEGDTNLRDIKPQAELPLSNIGLYLLATAAMLMVVGYFIIRKLRQPGVVIDTRLPHQRALDDLALVAAMELPEDGRFKEHYTRISDTLRSYASQRYNIDILERTTAEVKGIIRQTDMPTDAAGEFIKLLEESDMVKFTEIKPRVADAYLTLNVATQFVEYTKPADPDEDKPANKRRKAKRKDRAPFSVSGTHNKAEVTA